MDEIDEHPSHTPTARQMFLGTEDKMPSPHGGRGGGGVRAMGIFSYTNRTASSRVEAAVHKDTKAIPIPVFWKEHDGMVLMAEAQWIKVGDAA